MKIALRQFLIGRSAPEQLLILRLALMMKSLDPPRILWSDTEIFSNEIVAGHEVNYSSAPTARVLEQLNPVRERRGFICVAIPIPIAGLVEGRNPAPRLSGSACNFRGAQ